MKNYLNKIAHKYLMITAIFFAGIFFMTAKADAASNTNWQSVYADETEAGSLNYYVTYGRLQIAKNGNKIYVKKGSVNLNKKIKPGYRLYGGVLTNGKDIMYQNGKVIYLWKNVKTVKKLFSLKKKDDILIGRYGNNIYFGRTLGEDGFQVYMYNLKNKKMIKTKYCNGYYCNGKYLIIKGQFHEGVSTPLVLYNMKTGKTCKIAKHASSGNAAIIRGSNIYYSELDDSKWKWKIVKYNLKSKKKKTLSGNLGTKPIWLDQNYCYYVDEGKNVYIYDVRKRSVRFLENTGNKLPSEIYKGLWLSDQKDNDGYNYGMYFVPEENLLLIGWVSKEKGGDYFIKGNPFSYQINSSGIVVRAGYKYGSEIVNDEMKDGIPKLKFDGKHIVCTGGKCDGMKFSYTSGICRYEIDN